MHLVSLEDQTLEIGEKTFNIKAGESIHTECSHKYSLETFKKMARFSGFEVERSWTDSEKLFAVVLLRSFD